MPTVQHIHDPDTLWVVWQAAEPHARLRRVVGRIERRESGAELIYEYGSPDFESAIAAGFEGIRAFPVSDDYKTYTTNVLAYLERRVPPRHRQDFNGFLDQYCLPHDPSLSTMALVGYSTAQLPSDSFAFLHPFDVEGPVEFISEIAGTHHQEVTPSELRESISSSLEIVQQPNEVEACGYAYEVLLRDRKVGYINRAYIKRFTQWLTENKSLQAELVRVNGTEDRPRAFAFIKIT